MTRLVCGLIPIWIAVSAPGAVGDRPTLTIALDDGPQSRMLKAELSRDWTRPNPSVRLNRALNKDVEIRGAQLNALAQRIKSFFRIVYMTADEAPLSVRFHLPAVRINRGVWESLDSRAFAFSGRPLMTLDWYRARRVAIVGDRARPTSTPYWDYCSCEGFSGDADAEEARAPWDFGNKFVSYEDATRRAADRSE